MLMYKGLNIYKNYPIVLWTSRTKSSLVCMTHLSHGQLNYETYFSGCPGSKQISCRVIAISLFQWQIQLSRVNSQVSTADH